MGHLSLLGNEILALGMLTSARGGSALLAWPPMPRLPRSCLLEPCPGAVRRVASPWPRGPGGMPWPRAGSRGACFAFTRRLQGQRHSARLGEGTL